MGLANIHGLLEQNLVGETVSSISWCSRADSPRFTLSSGKAISFKIFVSTVDYDLGCTLFVDDERSDFWPQDSLGSEPEGLENCQGVTTAEALSGCVNTNVVAVHTFGNDEELCIRLVFSNGQQLEYSTGYVLPGLTMVVGSSAG